MVCISPAGPPPFQLPRPARTSDRTPIAFLISSTMISGGMVMPPQTRGPAMTRSGRGSALISRAIHPMTLNSGTMICLACLVAEFFVRPRAKGLDLHQPHTNSFIGQQTDGLTALKTAVPDVTMSTSASMFSVSISPSSQAIVCFRTVPPRPRFPVASSRAWHS